MEDTHRYAIEGQAGFLVARITLSENANGSAFYLGSAFGLTDAGGVIFSRLEISIINGVFVIPEPIALFLAVMGSVGLCFRHRK